MPLRVQSVDSPELKAKHLEPDCLYEVVGPEGCKYVGWVGEYIEEYDDFGDRLKRRDSFMFSGTFNAIQRGNELWKQLRFVPVPDGANLHYTHE